MGYNRMGKQGMRVCICGFVVLDGWEGYKESGYAVVGCTGWIWVSGGAYAAMGIMGQEI